MTLLVIEILILRIFLIIIFLLRLYKLNLLLLYFLVFVVCERVLGLTLLVYIVRNNGNDNLINLNLILW